MLEKADLRALKIQPVGNGLIDLICSPDQVDAFVDLCNRRGLAIRGFTWWCHVTGGHAPCGMGGPKSVYYDGWFSEIPMEEIVRLTDNESYRDYFNAVRPAQRDARACHWPGFWLEEASKDR